MSQLKMVRKETALEDAFRTIELDGSDDTDLKTYLEWQVPILENLNFTGIEFPVSLKDIDKFEKQNPEIKVNVFGYEKSVHILRINKIDPQNAIDLLFVPIKEKQHYCWIKSFSRLLSAQVSKHKAVSYFCKRCLNKFA